MGSLSYMILAGALVIAGPALAGGDDEGDNHSFDTPSHNLCCHFIPAGGTEVYKTADGQAELSCSRNEPKPLNLTLNAVGKLVVDEAPGEVPGCGNPEIVGYGMSWEKEPFRCHSEETGLICTVKGKGFKLSKAGVQQID